MHSWAHPTWDACWFNFMQVLSMALFIGLYEIYDLLEQLTDVLIIAALETLMVFVALFVRSCWILCLLIHRKHTFGWLD